MHIRYLKIFALWLAAVLFITGCSGGLLSGEDGKERGAVLALNINASTKNVSDGQEDFREELHQHVEYVRVYLFEGGQFVASEIVNWTQESGKTVEQKHVLENRLEIGKTYTLLAVGLDSDANDNFQIQAEDGVTPSTISANLKSDKTEKDIKVSEIFSGCISYTPTEQRETATIDMFRRMAGLEAYFKNIPEEATIQVIAHQPQNSIIALQAKEADDYGQSPLQAESGKVLLEMEAPAINHGEGNDWGYVLPMSASPASTTLEVVILSSDGGSVRYPVICRDEKSGTSTASFPLEANHLYRLGTRDNPVDLSDGFRFYITIMDLDKGGDYYYEYN